MPQPSIAGHKESKIGHAVCVGWNVIFTPQFNLIVPVSLSVVSILSFLLQHLSGKETIYQPYAVHFNENEDHFNLN